MYYVRYHSDNDDWEPLLYPYQQAGSNVLFFTFINPATMEVPVAFRKLGVSLLILLRKDYNWNLMENNKTKVVRMVPYTVRLFQLQLVAKIQMELFLLILSSSLL